MSDDIDSKYALTGWGQEQFRDLTVPSGQTCQVRMPGVQAMIEGGVLENADTLSSLVGEKHIKRVQGKATAPKNTKGQGATNRKSVDIDSVDTASLMKDPKQVKRVLQLVDKVVAYMVIQPTVRRPFDVDEDGKETPITNRVEGIVYTDVLPLDDRMFIFQYAVGGSTDLETFRRQFNTDLGSVAAQ